jgi:hypothetical protein
MMGNVWLEVFDYDKGSSHYGVASKRDYYMYRKCGNNTTVMDWRPRLGEYFNSTGIRGLNISMILPRVALHQN